MGYRGTPSLFNQVTPPSDLEELREWIRIHNIKVSELEKIDSILIDRAYTAVVSAIKEWTNRVMV